MLRPVLETPKYNLSIQASSTHCCSPRETFTELDSYSEVDLALFTKENEWVTPREDEVIQKFPEFVELMEYWEEGDVAFAGYVPMGLVNKFIDYLNSLERV